MARETAKSYSGSSCASTSEAGSRRSFLFDSSSSFASLDGSADVPPVGACRRSFDTRNLMAERVGAEISSRYDISPRKIGVGGYGKVYMAKDRACQDRLVAVKKISMNGINNIEDVRHEVDIMKVLDHPNICKLFETYIDSTAMFLIIEYFEGGDLADRLMEDGKIDEDSAAYIIQQVTSALRYAHGKDIAHRDMKPENVCFCSSDVTDNRIKVIDWGLGKHFGLVSMTSCVGSSMYAAPEVLDFPLDSTCEDIQGYTSACDLWSLGVLAYVSISGTLPFRGHELQVLEDMKNERYSFEAGVWEGVSSDAKDFIRRLLKVTPDDRPPAGNLLKHPWLARRFFEVEAPELHEILSKVEQFSHAPDFLSICVASVARQLDHRSLDSLYRVFSRLDTNGDGTLEVHEVYAGFQEAFGVDSEEVAGVGDMFRRLDLDGTGRVTYTEFCAAGIGEASYTQEQVLWAAFKIFDIHDHGSISAEDVQQVLANADVKQVWSRSVCEYVAQEVMENFGGEDGQIDFQEWLLLMRECASHHAADTPTKRTKSDPTQDPVGDFEDSMREFLKIY